ncbi:hypothetical protein FDZ71_07385 [bacterium]|nr:MAG: hypothetical protein FDZ71_07385 [bacterium]
MTEKIPEYGWSILATAMRGVHVDSPEAWLRTLRELAEPVELQVFDAGGLAGRGHLYFAVLFALKAFEEATNVSMSLPMEVLLQASAQRQVSKAIEVLGVKPGVNDVVVVLMSKDDAELQRAFAKLTDAYRGVIDESLLNLSPAKLQALRPFFDISDVELSSECHARDPALALTNLIMERMTLEAARRRPSRRAPREKPSTARS